MEGEDDDCKTLWMDFLESTIKYNAQCSVVGGSAGSAGCQQSGV